MQTQQLALYFRQLCASSHIFRNFTKLDLDVMLRSEVHLTDTNLTNKFSRQILLQISKSGLEPRLSRVLFQREVQFRQVTKLQGAWKLHTQQERCFV
jgi:hypothetical protein